MEQFLGGFLGLLVKGFSVEFGLKGGFVLQGSLVVIVEELLIHKLRGELLEQWGFVVVGGELELEGRVLGLGWGPGTLLGGLLGDLG